VRRLLFAFITGLLFLAATSSAWASDGHALPEGWQAHHPIHIRGGVHKGIHPALSSSGGGYTPAQIRHAYGIDQLSNTGAGQTIAIIEAYGGPTISADLTAFDNEYRLSAPPNLTIHSLGSPDNNPSNSDLESWAQETSLDVEWAHALAPDANILLVEARSDNGDDLFSAVQYANAQSPQIVSMSWGGSEFSSPSESSCDTAYFSHPGTIYLAASGDNGTVTYPASSPNVIAVGGTSLPLDANGNPTGSETAWSDSYGSSGGGISSYEAQPSWQTSFGISFSGSKRCVPDVAFDADPNTGVNVYFDGSTFGGSAGWFTTGGTSLSVQCWAAIMALADQDSSITNASQALYRLAGSQGNFNPYGAFRDITSGGYDLVTGLGSPVANVLVPAFPTTPTITPPGGAYILPYTVKVSISASPSVGQSVYYAIDSNQLTTSSSPYSAPFTLALSERTTTVYAAVYAANTGAWSGSSEASYTGIAALAAPTISPDGGSIATTQQITITDPNSITGDSVYYTLDGTKPGLQSNPYAAPFTLNSSATVTAAVYNSTAGWSQAASAVFTVPVAGGGGGGGAAGGGAGGGAAGGATPTAQTENATSIIASSAILNGNIASNGNSNITEYGFLWGTSQNNLNNTLQVGTDNHSGTFTTTLSNLTGGTTYYFQAYAKNANGTADGTIMSFTAAEAVQQPVSPVQEPAQTFSDVTSSYWAYDAISDLSRLDYITGYPDGSFKPDGAITRAEFVSILSRVLKLQTYNPPASEFSDVSSSDWFYGSVESAVYAGIVNGESNVSFSPDKPITREEMATILVNALGQQNEAEASMGANTGFADDASISSWAKGFVIVAAKDGLLKGYPDSSFRPQGDATRAEACSMINSFLGILK